jgi:hypothetical protein
MTSLQELAVNTIMSKLCKDLNKEIDNLILLLKSKKELSRQELTNINNIAINIIKEFKINIKDNTYTLDINSKKTSYSINTAVQSRNLPTWMQTIADVKKTRKTLFKHYDVRHNYINKIELYAKSLNNKKCIISAHNILKIIKDIKDKSMTL